MCDHVPTIHSGSWPCSWFCVSSAAGLHCSLAISGMFCWIFPSHSAKKANLPCTYTHRCWGSSAMRVMLCVVDCMEDRDMVPGLQTLTLTPIWPIISCHRQASEGSTGPLWEHSSYKQHLFGGWCLAAGHDPVSHAGTGLMQFPHDPSGRKASSAFGVAVFVLSFLKTNTILLIKSHALRMLDSECTSIRCMLAMTLPVCYSCVWYTVETPQCRSTECLDQRWQTCYLLSRSTKLYYVLVDHN